VAFSLGLHLQKSISRRLPTPDHADRQTTLGLHSQIESPISLRGRMMPPLQEMFWRKIRLVFQTLEV
jgi:hypothetical protein